MASQDPNTFNEVRDRLNEIVEAVSDDGLSLDDALALYEEAVALGLRASDLLESDLDTTEEKAAVSSELAREREGREDELPVGSDGSDGRSEDERRDGAQPAEVGQVADSQ
ncbi:MAG: exodeoxyribonuclease VII small subunit [Berryella intestinalis]|uniref:exodeoxyribonuclease VII small subunit n=1 Tax=Berryella intestinalis TaxID=1531429 RepID=UPI0009E539B0|nr:exodeoxyribonuclease VII small subunit [Berryella intestinalis]MDD7368745.1 exodeoxyribonuclease VII small subunit [Berryella intestinalis]MDY3128744.1 exodeoxyribonuclease VII small subunit [Berryella intestinalis]